jgi:hypothetical protein
MSFVAAAPNREELEATLRGVDPRVLLVPPRILRRVVKRVCSIGGPGLQVPHRKSLVVDRDTLLRIAGPAELGVLPGAALPETLLLLAETDASLLATTPRDQVVNRYWRLLFHGQVHAELKRRRRDGKLTEADVRRRAERLGRTDLAAAMAVLRQENLLLPPGDLRTLYEEFAAVYLELRYFDPQRLPSYFPLADYDAIDRVLAEDVDAPTLFERSRPEGAAVSEPDVSAFREVQSAQYRAPAALEPNAAAFARRMAAAARSRGRGNVVRAALRAERAARVGSMEQAAEARRAASTDLDRLAARLQKALDIPPADVARWQRILHELLVPAAGGRWTAEGRLLYDLQKACLDHEREVYAVDIVEWIASSFRRPIRRHLPHQRQVLLVKRLRQAARRLPALRLPHELREQFRELLHDAVSQGECRLRDRFRPAARAALESVGLSARNRCEAVARAKIVEELLDRVIERDLLTMSDLRDAVARNRVKLPDLSGPEFVLGDRLIRANRILARNLDGVYRRGEIYLRWLQRLSSAAFGTRIGRFLTLFLVLPFAGAFMLLEGFKAVLHELPGHHGRHTHDAPWLANHLYGEIVPTAVLGVVLLGVIHSPPFRTLLLGGLRLASRASRALLIDLPALVLRLPAVRRFLQSRIYVLLYLFVFKPLLWAGLTTLGLYLADFGTWNALAGGVTVFLATGLLLNSGLGSRVEELLTDQIVRTWQLFQRDVLPGLYYLVIGVFRSIMEWVERALYAVDEWLRFRTGDSPVSAIVKPILGLVWFFFAYAVRAVINLFVEPTFNPLKHFPVVTVAAKLLFPFIPALAPALTRAATPVLGPWLAGFFAAAVLFFIPGFAGFLVWELKENWRLYEANQPETLRPLAPGSHGETVRRLLRAGFHSGTVPKLFAKLRRADGAAARKGQEDLHHVAEALGRFVERDLLAILEHCPRWGDSLRLRRGDIHLGTNRIRCELRCRDAADPPLVIDIDLEGAFLLARVRQAGWLPRLSDCQRAALADALAAFYRLAGVDIVREELESLLPAGLSYVCTESGVCLWPASGIGNEICYALDAQAIPDATTVQPPFRIEQVLLSARPIRWTDWVAAVERGEKSETAPAVAEDTLLLRAVQLSPATSADHFGSSTQITSLSSRR